MAERRPIVLQNGEPVELPTADVLPLQEKVFSVTGTSPSLDPVNGTLQLWVLSGNSSPTDAIADGESLTLMVDDGAAYTITWPAISWVGGSAPTLATSGKTIIELWKIGGTLYGVLVGEVA